MTQKTKVYVNRTFNCTAETLFEWLTQPELIAQWFGPKHLKTGKVSSNLQVGGNYSIELLKPNGDVIGISGAYEIIDPPVRLRYTSIYFGLDPAPPDGVVTITLEDLEDGRCALSLVQAFEVVPQDMPTRTQAWEHMFETLGILVS